MTLIHSLEKKSEKSSNEIMVEKLCFSYLLGFPFVSPLVLVINAREIRHNDGDGKGDDQDSRQGANATDQFA